MQKRALITGITGQDGSYLAELLLSKGYQVFGLERRSSQRNRNNIQHLLDRITLVSGDLLDESSIVHAIRKAELTEGDEVYNLASQSFVKESWNQPVYTGEVTGIGAVRVLEAIRQVNKGIKFYQASSSEMFGHVSESPQNEDTAFYPRSPYGVAKLYAHWATKNYRESYDMFAVSGILFNHESPRRGLEFVTRKITHTLAHIKAGLMNKLELGDLSPKRDWGFAGDYVVAMWLMMQQPEPEDFVIATGYSHTVCDFLKTAGNYFDMDLTQCVQYGSIEHSRPAEVFNLQGDFTKAQWTLGWEPTVDFNGLVRMMAESDLKIAMNKKRFSN